MIIKFCVPFVAVLLSAAIAPAASADPTTNACRAAPTRVCVFETAMAVAASLREPATRANLIAQIAAMQQQAGLADAASAAFARAVEEAKTVTGSQADLPLIGLAAARAEMGDSAAALDSAHAGKASGTRAFALTGVAAALVRLGRVDKAAPIFDEALEAARGASSYERPFALIHLALAQAKAGLASASSTFDLAFETAKESKMERNLVAVATQRVRAGEFVQAFTDIGELPQPLRSVPLQTLAEAEATSGRVDDAAQVARSISDNAGRAAALATVAVAAARAKRAADAEEMIVDAHSAAEAETVPAAKAAALAHVAGAEAISGFARASETDLDAARAAAAGENQPFARDSVNSAISLALARAGQASEAIALASSASSPVSRYLALRAIADDREAANDVKAAFVALVAEPADARQVLNLAEFALRMKN